MYSKFRILIFITSILIFTGCDDFYKTEQVKVNIIDIDPPKHFRIIVYDKESKVQSSVSISKRCRVKDNLIGSETTVTRNTYIDTDTGKYSYNYSKYMDKSTYCY